MAETMAELKLQVPQRVIDSINEKLRLINGGGNQDLSPADIGIEALTVYEWAVDRTSRGLAIVSADANKSLIGQVATKHLPAKAPTVR